MELLKTCMFYLGKHDLISWGCKLRSFKMEIKSFFDTFTNIWIKPAKQQTFFPSLKLPCLDWGHGLRRGEVGWANVWKTQEGAVRSVTNIYSLHGTYHYLGIYHPNDILYCNNTEVLSSSSCYSSYVILVIFYQLQWYFCKTSLCSVHCTVYSMYIVQFTWCLLYRCSHYQITLKKYEHGRRESRTFFQYLTNVVEYLCINLHIWG